MSNAISPARTHTTPMEARDMQTAYKGYTLATDASDGRVGVYDPRWPTTPVYIATDDERARSWINAYRRGAIWAAKVARVSA